MRFFGLTNPFNRVKAKMSCAGGDSHDVFDATDQPLTPEQIDHLSAVVATKVSEPELSSSSTPADATEVSEPEASVISSPVVATEVSATEVNSNSNAADATEIPEPEGPVISTLANANESSVNSISRATLPGSREALPELASDALIDEAEIANDAHSPTMAREHVDGESVLSEANIELQGAEQNFPVVEEELRALEGDDTMPPEATIERHGAEYDLTETGQELQLGDDEDQALPKAGPRSVASEDSLNLITESAAPDNVVSTTDKQPQPTVEVSTVLEPIPECLLALRQLMHDQPNPPLAAETSGEHARCAINAAVDGLSRHPNLPHPTIQELLSTLRSQGFKNFLEKGYSKEKGQQWLIDMQNTELLYMDGISILVSYYCFMNSHRHVRLAFVQAAHDWQDFDQPILGPLIDYSILEDGLLVHGEYGNIKELTDQDAAMNAGEVYVWLVYRDDGCGHFESTISADATPDPEIKISPLPALKPYPTEQQLLAQQCPKKESAEEDVLSQETTARLLAFQVTAGKYAFMTNSQTINPALPELTGPPGDASVSLSMPLENKKLVNNLCELGVVKLNDSQKALLEISVTQNDVVVVRPHTSGKTIGALIPQIAQSIKTKTATALLVGDRLPIFSADKTIQQLEEKTGSRITLTPTVIYVCGTLEEAIYVYEVTAQLCKGTVVFPALCIGQMKMMCDNPRRKTADIVIVTVGSLLRKVSINRVKFNDLRLVILDHFEQFVKNVDSQWPELCAVFLPKDSTKFSLAKAPEVQRMIVLNEINDANTAAAAMFLRPSRPITDLGIIDRPFETKKYFFIPAASDVIITAAQLVSTEVYGKTIVFARTIQKCISFARALSKLNPVRAIGVAHSDISLNYRSATFNQFRLSKSDDVLVVVKLHHFSQIPGLDNVVLCDPDFSQAGELDAKANRTGQKGHVGNVYSVYKKNEFHAAVSHKAFDQVYSNATGRKAKILIEAEIKKSASKLLPTSPTPAVVPATAPSYPPFTSQDARSDAVPGSSQPFDTGARSLRCGQCGIAHDPALACVRALFPSSQPLPLPKASRRRRSAASRGRPASASAQGPTPDSRRVSRTATSGNSSARVPPTAVEVNHDEIQRAPASENGIFPPQYPAIYHSGGIEQLPAVLVDVAPQQDSAIPDVAPQQGPGFVPQQGPGVAPQQGPGVAPQQGPGVAPQQGPGFVPQQGLGVAPQQFPGVYGYPYMIPMMQMMPMMQMPMMQMPVMQMAMPAQQQYGVPGQMAAPQMGYAPIAPQQAPQSINITVSSNTQDTPGAPQS